MNSSPNKVIIGIDWADQAHAVAILIGNQLKTQTLEQTPEAIDQWAIELQTKYPDQTITVCLEQSKGALIYALMKYGFLQLVPINPSQLSSYRDTLKTSGAKDDPSDAQLLAQFAARHQDQLKPLVRDDEATRFLRALCEDRRALVDRRSAVTNTMKSRLKQYFPQALTIFRDLRTELACQFLKRFSSLQSFQAAGFADIQEMVAMFAGNNCKQMIERMKEVHQNGKPLIDDTAISNSAALLIRCLAGELKSLLTAIAEYDHQIAAAMKRHADHAIFESLPGAGAALAPRLLVAFGSVREHYESARQIQELSGIAPVLRRSGRSVQVQRRLACNKFLRQTFHEFASCSRLWSPWAKAFYDLQRKRGKRHHAAIRSLAYKWIRIIFRCWKDKTKFDELYYFSRTTLKTSSQ